MYYKVNIIKTKTYLRPISSDSFDCQAGWQLLVAISGPCGKGGWLPLVTSCLPVGAYLILKGRQEGI